MKLASSTKIKSRLFRASVDNYPFSFLLPYHLGNTTRRRKHQVFPGESQSRLKFYSVHNRVRLLRAFEKLHDCRKMHTGEQTGKTATNTE